MSKEWWKTFFDKSYIHQWELAGMFKHTKQEINFLERVIPIQKNDKILDLCCGHGRHSLELAQRGYKVTGLDYSTYELGIAQNEAKRKRLSVNFIQADARDFRFNKQKFDVVINMFNSFGYGDKEDDFKIINNVSRVLKKGGKFFIDLQSLPWLWKHFQPLERQKIGSWRIIIERHYDFLEQVSYNRRTVLDKKHKKIYFPHLRNYTLAELKIIFESQKLRIINFFGSYGYDPFGPDHKRMLVLAQKI